MPAAEPARWRRALRDYVELFSLNGFAVAQPLLDLFGNAPDSFLARRASDADLVLFALVVVLVPPAVVWLAVQAIALADRRAGRWAQAVALGGFGLLLAIQVAKKSPLPKGALLLVVGVLVGALVVVLYRRVGWIKDWLVFAALAPWAFGAIFLFSSPASSVRGQNRVEAVKVEQARTPVSIVMVVWDEWPLVSLPNKAGQLDPQLYPHLAALAKDGVWYRNATTVASATNYAVPSILTGRHAHDGSAIASASTYPENLFTLLASQYDLEVTESVTRLCPQNLCSGPFVDNPDAALASTGGSVPGGAAAPAPPAPKEPPSGLGAVLSDAWQTFQALVSPSDQPAGIVSFDESVTVQTPTTPPPATGTTRVRTEDAVKQAQGEQAEATPIGGAGGLPVLRLDTVDKLISSIEVGEQPTLHFLHVQLPHTPYKFLPGGQAYSEIPTGGLDPAMMAAVIGNQSPDQGKVDIDKQRLLLQVGYVDRLVGDVTARLKATGLYDRSIVIMTSDHGAGFVPGQTIRALSTREAIPESLYADLLYVPMVVKGPGLPAGTVSDDNVMSIDLVPTIADMIGIKVPWAVDGRSLLGPRRDTDEKVFRKVTIGAFAGDPAPGGGPPPGAGGPSGAGGPGPGGGGPPGAGGPPGGAGPPGGGPLAGMAMTAGPPVTFSGKRFEAEMLARGADSLLRDDNPEHRWYDITDAGELVGRRVADVPSAGGGTVTATLDDATKLTSPPPGSAIVPSHLLGRITGGVDAAAHPLVAVAVNGVVAAVVPTYAEGTDPHRVEAILDPATIRTDGNEVRLYLVGGTEGARTLAPVTV